MYKLGSTFSPSGRKISVPEGIEEAAIKVAEGLAVIAARTSRIASVTAKKYRTEPVVTIKIHTGSLEDDVEVKVVEESSGRFQGKAG